MIRGPFYPHPNLKFKFYTDSFLDSIVLDHFYCQVHHISIRSWSRLALFGWHLKWHGDSCGYSYWFKLIDFIFSSKDLYFWNISENNFVNSISSKENIKHNKLFNLTAISEKNLLKNVPAQLCKKKLRRNKKSFNKACSRNENTFLKFSLKGNEFLKLSWH